MAARNEDQGEPSTEPHGDSQPPAGLSFGRRQFISRETSTAARRGQVKGLFGIATPSLPIQPAPERSDAPMDLTETRAVSAAQAPASTAGEFSDPLDAFFGGDQSMAAASVLQARAERAAIEPSDAQDSGGVASIALRRQDGRDEERPADIRAAIDERRAEQRGLGAVQAPQSGMRHKRVDPGRVGLHSATDESELDEAIAAGPDSTTAERQSSVKPVPRTAPAELVEFEAAASARGPRWLLTGSILAGALVLGGAFMFWSLRSTDATDAQAGLDRVRPGGQASSENDIVTWSPQAEHSHAPQAGPREAAPATAPPAPGAPAQEAPPGTTAASPSAAAPSAAAPRATASAPSAAVPAAAERSAEASPSGAAEASAREPAMAAQPRNDAPEASAPPDAHAATSAQNAAHARADAAHAASTVLAAARKKLGGDDPVGAEDLMRKLLTTDPQNQQATELLAHALIDQDRGKDALPLARRLVQRNSQHLAYRLMLGDVLLMVGDEAGAKAEWQRALAQAPDNAEVKRRLGL